MRFFNWKPASAPVKQSFQEVAEYATQETEQALSMFTTARNQLLLANETIGKTQAEIKEEIASLESTQGKLSEQITRNEKLINNITGIIE